VPGASQAVHPDRRARRAPASTAIGNTDTSVSGVGYFAEADETVPMADSVTMTVAAPRDLG